MPEFFMPQLLIKELWIQQTFFKVTKKFACGIKHYLAGSRRNVKKEMAVDTQHTIAQTLNHNSVYSLMKKNHTSVRIT